MLISDHWHTHTPPVKQGYTKKHVHPVQRNMVEKPFKLVSAVLALEQETVLLYHTTLYQKTKQNPLLCHAIF